MRGAKKTRKRSSTPTAPPEIEVGFALLRADGSMSYGMPRGRGTFIVGSGAVSFEFGPVDVYGVPPHAHGKVRMAGRDVSFRNAVENGGSVEQAVIARNFPDGRVVLCVGSPDGFLIMGFALNVPFDKDAEGKKRDPLVGAWDVPAHTHWMPYRKPIPFDAAWRILLGITEAELIAGLLACNCEPSTPPQHREFCMDTFVVQGEPRLCTLPFGHSGLCNNGNPNEYEEA